jgi:hypothetical protein
MSSLGKACQWLLTVLDCNTIQPFIATVLDTTLRLNLSCLAFFTSQEAEASSICMPIWICVKKMQVTGARAIDNVVARMRPCQRAADVK